MKLWLTRIAVSLAVLLGLGALAFMCSRVAARGRFATSCSTVSAGPDGTRGLYELAQREGLRATRLTQDFGALPEGGMLVALAMSTSVGWRAPTPVEKRLLLRFVERGGVVLIAGDTSYLPEEIPISTADAALNEPGHSENDDNVNDPPPLHAAQATTPLLQGLARLGFRSPTSVDVRLKGEGAATALLHGDVGTMAAVARHGRGAVIMLASPSPLQNRDLVDADGAAMFSRLIRAYAPQGPVVFDEYHLGIGERRSYVKYLADFGVGALAAQVLVIALFIFMRASTRLGPPSEALPPLAAGTASYVAAIGKLYRASKDGSAALGVLMRDAIRRVARYHAIAVPENAHVLVTALEHANKNRAAEESRELVSIETIGHKNLSFASQRIDEIVKRATADAVEPKG